MIDFTPLKTARLGPADVSKVLEVSRVTVSGWFNGHTQPHHLLTRRVQRMVDSVNAAIVNGDLPIPHHVKRRERGFYIDTALAKALRPKTEDV